MNNMLHIVIAVLAIQAVALLVAMAFGRAAKAGDHFDGLDGQDEFNDARAIEATLSARHEAARAVQAGHMPQSGC